MNVIPGKYCFVTANEVTQYCDTCWWIHSLCFVVVLHEWKEGFPQELWNVPGNSDLPPDYPKALPTVVSHIITCNWISSRSVPLSSGDKIRTGYNRTLSVLLVNLLFYLPQHMLWHKSFWGQILADCQKKKRNKQTNKKKTKQVFVNSFCIFINIPDLFNTCCTTRTSSPAQMSMRTRQFCMKQSNLLKKRLWFVMKGTLPGAVLYSPTEKSC